MCTIHRFCAYVHNTQILCLCAQYTDFVPMCTTQFLCLCAQYTGFVPMCTIHRFCAYVHNTVFVSMCTIHRFCAYVHNTQILCLCAQYTDFVPMCTIHRFCAYVHSIQITCFLIHVWVSTRLNGLQYCIVCPRVKILTYLCFVYCRSKRGKIEQFSIFCQQTTLFCM